MIATLYLVGLLIAASASTPRRVGDGGEYLVMALQLAAGRPTALSADELRETRARLAQLDAGFESSLLEYPDLVGNDGRQDFLHFFLYSLVVAPMLSVVSAFGAHPNWAFTFINALLLALALFLTVRRQPLIACIAGFVSPIVWWTDKAHTEAFLFAGVAVGALLFRQQPAQALIAFALAGAQNAALGVTYPAFVLLSAAVTGREGLRKNWWLAAGIGAALVFSPFLYAWLRLGRWSTMAEYAQRSVPSLGGVAAFILEPNIGIIPNAPVYALSLGAALWLSLARRTSPTRPPAPMWWWPIVLQALLLLAWSQNPNANHGGTPGMNRWVLSLLALALPLIADWYRALTNTGRGVLSTAVVAASIASVPGYLPVVPENYRVPSRLALGMWNAGWLHVTPAEVFAERTLGREPADAPAHDGACRVLLIANQQAPVACAPPTEALPASCRGPGAMCYAVVDVDRTRYVMAPNNGFFYNVSEPSWPVGGPLANGVHRALREADPAARVWRIEESRRWVERLTGADVGVVLGSEQANVVYVRRASASTLQALGTDARTRVLTLIPFGPAEYSSAVLTNVVVIVDRSGRS